MKSLLRIVHFAIVLTLGMPVVSKAQPGEAVGKNWERVVVNLQESGGRQKIGDLSLQSLLDEGRMASWVQIPGAPSPVQSGSRRSAYYRDGDRVIHYSSSLRAETSKNLEALELHEVLRFTHHNDDDYSLSTALVTLAYVPPSRGRNMLADLYARRYFQARFMIAMGGTSVSGGGDSAAITAKNQIIQNLLFNSNDASPVSDEFLALYPSIGFEPLQNPALHEVYVDYKFVIQTSPAGGHESVAVYLPMAIWNQGGAARAAVIADASQKIMSIFPASTNSRSHTFRPEGCRANQTVTYPLTNDPAVLSIQSLRGSIKLGCRQFVEGQTSLEAIAPALPRETEPERAGQSYFDCKFTYKNYSTSNIHVAPYGMSMHMSFGWSLASDDYLDGEIKVSKTGELLATGILYRPPGASASANNYQRAQDRPTSVGRGKSTLNINGYPLAYECQKRL